MDFKMYNVQCIVYSVHNLRVWQAAPLRNQTCPYYILVDKKNVECTNIAIWYYIADGYEYEKRGSLLSAPEQSPISPLSTSEKLAIRNEKLEIKNPPSPRPPLHPSQEGKRGESLVALQRGAIFTPTPLPHFVN